MIYFPQFSEKKKPFKNVLKPGALLTPGDFNARNRAENAFSFSTVSLCNALVLSCSGSESTRPDLVLPVCRVSSKERSKPRPYKLLAMELLLEHP